MFMNKFESDILKHIVEKNYINQRKLAERTGHSLGMVNRSIKNLTLQGYLSETLEPTEKALQLIEDKKPKNAVILAAGFGMRMVPINYSSPKGLLEIHGEVLIERLIRQLQEVGVTDITIVVGFLKERFEYLIDEFGVELVVNPDYATKNNLHSLYLAKDKIDATYIVPSDVWCKENPFHKHEMYSWYMVSEMMDPESGVKVNRKGEIVYAAKNTPGNAMLGIAYLLPEDAQFVLQKLNAYSPDARYDASLWESVLFADKKMIIPAKVVDSASYVEINTYEQLKELDSESSHLKSESLELIAQVFHTSVDQIKDIEMLKKGMTNRSFLFRVEDKKYIMRIPGEGTSNLINRQQEAEVFRTISGKGLCDDPVYIDPGSGYKITAFLNDVRVCDSDSIPDLERCMAKLREFHEMNLQVGHSFDIFGQINLYEKLWNGTPSVYKDYKKTKENVFSLREYIDRQDKQWCLTHIDAVCDNFLFYTLPGEKEERLQLTDWEYAGLQDPHVDIAMFCVYSMYDKPRVDRLIDIYFQGNCPASVRAKIYCYIAACGLLWSNWTEYKSTLGVEFGEYGIRQYRFAKNYYRFAKEEMEKAGV